VLLVVVISVAVVGSIGAAVTNQLEDVTNQLPNSLLSKLAEDPARRC
jgi:Flp pilus assembly pilin Flp